MEHRGVNSSVSDGGPACIKKESIKVWAWCGRNNSPHVGCHCPLTPRESVRLPGVGLFSTKCYTYAPSSPFNNTPACSHGGCLHASSRSISHCQCHAVSETSHAAAYALRRSAA